MSSVTHMANAQNLRMFDDTEEGRARARELGARGGKKRAENARKRREAAEAENRDPVEALELLSGRFNREDLGPMSAQVAMMLLGKITSGEIEVQGRDVANLIQVLVNVTRLEEGQSTNNTVHVALSAGDAMERIRMLRAQGQGAVEMSSSPAIEASTSDEVPT